MERFKMIQHGYDREWDVEMEESYNGEWVRFEDVEKIKAEAIAKALIDVSISNAKDRLVGDAIFMSCESVECNCDEMSDNEQIAWICPAHGYKKL